jgi:hypothetical protein
MALFSECVLQCAQKLLDTADIVRDAIFQRLPSINRYNPGGVGGEVWQVVASSLSNPRN